MLWPLPWRKRSLVTARNNGHGSEWPGSHKKDSTYLSEEARNRVRRLRIIYRDR
jgi:hypothetical protein